MMPSNYNGIFLFEITYMGMHISIIYAKNIFKLIYFLNQIYLILPFQFISEVAFVSFSIERIFPIVIFRKKTKDDFIHFDFLSPSPTPTKKT